MPKLTYLGHSAFLIESAKANLVIDPFLTGNPKAAKKPADIKVSYVLLSHGHGDHVGDAIEIAKANKATVIAPFELAGYCGSKGCEFHPQHIGGGFNYPFGRVQLTIAHHGSSNNEGAYMGEPCGFLITIDGKTLYHAGDTAVFYDMKLIGELHPAELALLPIGDNFTMGIDDAVKAAELVNAKRTIPMHYNTFDLIMADPNEFVSKVSKKGLKAEVLAVGASTDY
jgi:L-ascorbate metabolism protein UlaG (beta-lactamase superfamily)